MEIQRGQGQAGRGTELQGAKRKTCDTAIQGDFRNKRWSWGMDRDSGKGGKNGEDCEHLWERGRKWGTGFGGGDLQIL